MQQRGLGYVLLEAVLMPPGLRALNHASHTPQIRHMASNTQAFPLTPSHRLELAIRVKILRPSNFQTDRAACGRTQLHRHRKRALG